jgi:hypothetical protein
MVSSIVAVPPASGRVIAYQTGKLVFLFQQAGLEARARRANNGLELFPAGYQP